MLSQDVRTNGNSREDGSISKIDLKIQLERSPRTLEELRTALQAQGHQVDVLPMDDEGERPFGILGRVRVDDVECVAKLLGEQLADDDPNFAEMFVRQIAIEQEAEGLKGIDGLAPRLVAEIVVGDQTVGVLRQFMDGLSLPAAIKTGQLTLEQALVKGEGLVSAVNERGFRLWDCGPENLWLKPDGELILIEGQCVTPMNDEERANPGFAEEQRQFVRKFLS